MINPEHMMKEKEKFLHEESFIFNPKNSKVEIPDIKLSPKHKIIREKIYTKRIENFIYNEFEEELKKLSRSQGRILIKLVHRQTGTTTHDLVKELRNRWRAFIYQTTASLFDLTLKDTFDPKENYEDFMIEDILQRADSDNIIELDPTALTYDLDSLYKNWKFKKTDSMPKLQL